MLLQCFILESLDESLDAEVLAEVLEEDLDEDAGAGGGVVLGESDDGEARPADGLGVEQVPEELRSVPQLIHLQLVHVLVLLSKHVVEEGRIEVRVDQTETLS
jgi:hypothetical protein